jgi:hypothetical protein
MEIVLPWERDQQSVSGGFVQSKGFSQEIRSYREISVLREVRPWTSGAAKDLPAAPQV